MGLRGDDLERFLQPLQQYWQRDAQDRRADALETINNTFSDPDFRKLSAYEHLLFIQTAQGLFSSHDVDFHRIVYSSIKSLNWPENISKPEEYGWDYRSTSFGRKFFEDVKDTKIKGSKPEFWLMVLASRIWEFSPETNNDRPTYDILNKGFKSVEEGETLEFYTRKFFDNPDFQKIPNNCQYQIIREILANHVKPEDKFATLQRMLDIAHENNWDIYKLTYTLNLISKEFPELGEQTSVFSYPDRTFAFSPQSGLCAVFNPASAQFSWSYTTNARNGDYAETGVGRVALRSPIDITRHLTCLTKTPADEADQDIQRSSRFFDSDIRSFHRAILAEVVQLCNAFGQMASIPREIKDSARSAREQIVSRSAINVSDLPFPAIQIF